MSKFKKAPVFVPKKRYAPRPVSTTTTTISVESLVDEDNEEDTETCQNGPWFASLKALVWVNFVLTLVFILAFIIYALTRPSVVNTSLKEERTPNVFGSLSFNLVPHQDKNWAVVSLKSSNINVSFLKSMWVCCTKDNIYSCGFDASIMVNTVEAKISIKHPDKVGSMCYLHWC
jgi:hypothetical protein